MALANVLVHLVFSTKDRVPLIRSDVEPELYAYTSKVLDTSDSPMLAIGGMEDHVHILFKLSRKFAIADIVETVKTDTSRWLKSKSMGYADFYWQSGYGAFSVSPTMVKSLGIFATRRNIIAANRFKTSTEV
jgi:putative transposase